MQPEPTSIVPLRASAGHFNPTDVGNAARLVARHGRDLRYCHPWNQWFVFDGRLWQLDERGEAEARMKETLRSLLADAHEIDDDKARPRLVKHVLESERAGRIRGSLDLARSEPGVPVLPDDFDTDDWLLNVENGTVDLKTGELRPHDRADLITKLAPVTYDAEAVAHLWAAVLEKVLPDADDRELFRRIVGYCLTGVTYEQIVLIFYGLGANGKTTVMETVRCLMGDYAQQTPAETFTEHRDSIPNDVARLRGVRLALAAELGEGRRLNEALIKRMTGGEKIVARFMRAEWFEFAPKFTPILVTNHCPEIRGTDEAIWRRIRLVPFSVTIPLQERDPTLPAKLREELPGILNWAIDGCLAWQREGLPETANVSAATRQYRADSDLIGRFIEDVCDTADTYRCTSAELHQAYATWATATGEKPVSQNTLGRRLKERGYDSHRTGTARWWLGITPRSDA